MDRRSLKVVGTLCVLATMSLSAQTPAERRVAGQWKGMWATAPITLTLKLAGGAAKNANKVDVTGSLSLGAVKDPLGPQTVTPTTDVTGTVEEKGDVVLELTFPDFEGRSQPETFTGKVATDSATKQDTLTLKAKDNKTTLTLKHP